MTSIFVVGAGGQGKEVLQLLSDINQAKGNTWDIKGLLDDSPLRVGSQLYAYRVLGLTEWLINNTYQGYIICAIGDPKVKEQMIQRIGQRGEPLQFATLIHPSAVISSHSEINEGTIIGALTMISTDVSIGKQVLVNYGATIGHDSELSDYVSVMPGARISGSVKLGAGCYVGAGAVVLPGVKVGEYATIGAGAVVTKDVPPGHTVVGVPARTISKETNGEAK